MNERFRWMVALEFNDMNIFLQNLIPMKIEKRDRYEIAVCAAIHISVFPNTSCDSTRRRLRLHAPFSCIEIESVSRVFTSTSRYRTFATLHTIAAALFTIIHVRCSMRQYIHEIRSLRLTYWLSGICVHSCDMAVTTLPLI
jgi:hypothetical protein